MTAIIILAVVIAVAFVVQAVALCALYRVMLKSDFRMQGFIGRLKEQTSSILDVTHAILEDAEPKIDEITSNVAATKAAVQASLATAVEAWGEITNRARAQAGRLQELAGKISSKARVNNLGHDPRGLAETEGGSSRATAAR